MSITNPILNDPNVTQYLQSIESDANAYQNFYNDLENDFLQAIELRFTVNSNQRDYILNFTKHQKDTIKCNIKTCADYLLEDSYTGKKVVPSVSGISENPPVPINAIKVKGSAKIEHDMSNGHTKGSIGIEVSC